MSAARTFGTTWWGQAWVQALEGRAAHDPNRLPRGRTYARQGAPRDLSIEPGEVRALVRGSRLEPYEVLMTLRRFRDDEWEWVLDAIASSASYAAALLDGELDPGIVDEARRAEVELLPRSGELRTACTCPDWAEPCKHAAAVCYLVAEAIDADPFVLFRLRGLDRSGVLDAIRARRAATDGAAPTSPPALAEPGLVAREAWRRDLGDLPHAPAPPLRPGRPAPWPSAPPRSAPFTEEGLRLLALDAARRAWAVRADGSDTGLALPSEQDLARRAAGADRARRRALAERAGVDDAHLETLATAWAAAGAAGVRAVGEAAWTPPVSVMAAARGLVASVVGPAASLQVRSNRITVDGIDQFRLSRDGLWFRFAKASGRWTLIGGPAEDLDDLVGMAGAEG